MVMVGVGLLFAGKNGDQIIVEEVVEEVVDEESDMDGLYNDVKGTCVSLQTSKLSGQGNVLSIVGSEVRVITARHVVEYADSVSVSFENEVIGNGVVDYLSDQYDFAIVRLDVDEIPSRMSVVEFPEQKLLYEESVVMLPMFDKYVIGNVVELEGYFPEFNSNLNRHQMVVEPGMSGAGIFDVFGYYEGILVGGQEDESVSLPYDVILEALM